MIKIAPSILSADFAALGADVVKAAGGGADLIHIDVMDGHFVPNLTFGVPVIKALRKVTDVPFDVHLMVENPQQYVADLAEAGADIVTFHAEAEPHMHKAIQLIKEHGMKAGIVLNPGTPLNAIEEVLPDVDMVLLMTVNPGFGGQKFIPAVVDKIKRLRSTLAARGLHAEIEVDGGINLTTARQVAAAGADILVAGSAVYSAPNLAQVIAALKESQV